MARAGPGAAISYSGTPTILAGGRRSLKHSPRSSRRRSRASRSNTRGSKQPSSTTSFSARSRVARGRTSPRSTTARTAWARWSELVSSCRWTTTPNSTAGIISSPRALSLAIATPRMERRSARECSGASRRRGDRGLLLQQADFRGQRGRDSRDLCRPRSRDANLQGRGRDAARLRQSRSMARDPPLRRDPRHHDDAGVPRRSDLPAGRSILGHGRDQTGGRQAPGVEAKRLPAGGVRGHQP